MNYTNNNDVEKTFYVNREFLTDTWEQLSAIYAKANLSTSYSDDKVLSYVFDEVELKLSDGNHQISYYLSLGKDYDESINDLNKIIDTVTKLRDAMVAMKPEYDTLQAEVDLNRKKEVETTKDIIL